MRYLILCALLVIHSLSANPMKESYKEGKMVGQGALGDVKLAPLDAELNAEWTGEFKAPEGDKALEVYRKSSPKNDILNFVKETSTAPDKADLPCETPLNPMETVTAGGNPPFCIDGACADQGQDPNDTFEQAMTEMAVIYQMSKSPKGVGFFKGEKKSCKQEKHKKCCGVSKGIAVSLGLSSCSSQEKALSKLRGKGHCRYLGKKTLKKGFVKIGHKESYCCYGSKLLRIFNEQARLQLERKWKRKDKCGGLTLEEMQKLDFSEMDLSQAFKEVKQKWVNLSKVSDQVKQRFQTLTPQKIDSFNQRTGVK